MIRTLGGKVAGGEQHLPGDVGITGDRGGVI